MQPMGSDFGVQDFATWGSAWSYKSGPCGPSTGDCQLWVDVSRSAC